VCDLKTGRHNVEAKENKQMMIYALGLLRTYRRYNIDKVKLVIYQPFCGGASEWDTTVDVIGQFGEYASKRAILALDAYKKGKKGLKAIDFAPSADACQWCRFAEKCNARAKAAASQLASDSDLIATDINTESLKLAWDGLAVMKLHIEKVEKAVHSALMSGESLPGLKLVAGREGIRKWTNEDQVIAMLKGHGANTDVMYKQSFFSPTDAEKFLKSENTPALAAVQQFIERKPAAPVITDVEDKRPAWSVTQVTNEDLD
jgi:hypothetical protein